jgi:hypothetical protein
LAIKFLNAKKMAKAWGQAEPAELRKIFEYLCDSEGFAPPKDWSDGYTLVLKKEVQDDLVIEASFSTVGQYTVGVVNFDTGILLSSKYCKKIENVLELWPNQKNTVSVLDTAATIFCVHLSHLKWNAAFTEKNPEFQISELSEHQNSAQKWIIDWKAYAKPHIALLSNLKDAIQYCEYIKNYKKQPWVKSDGYRSSTIDIHLAFLCVQDGQYEKANAILESAWKLQTHTSSIDRHEKALNWVNEQLGLDQI